MKLTLIGNGAMALALARGLVKEYEVEVIGRDQNKLNKFKNNIPEVTTKLMEETEFITEKNIILCVKPYALEEVSKKLSGEANALFSVLAGTTVEKLKKSIQAKTYVRTMPNLSAAYGKSMTTITGDIKLQKEALDIFSNIGQTLWVNSEKELDIATAVAGSGPAFLALIAEAIADGGVKCGLKRDDSATLVKGLFEGFAPLLNQIDPSDIKNGVMSPGGTTAAGYCAMEDANVRSGMIKGIEAAFNRAIELGK